MNSLRDHRITIPLATLMVVSLLGLGVSRCSEQDLHGPVKGSRLPVETGATNLQTPRQSREQELAVRFREAVMMLHTRHYDHAVTALHRVLELAPRLPEAHVNMGFALLGLGQHAAARDFFTAAIELRPEQVNAYWGLAESLEALCDIAGATGAMRSYIHLAPGEDPFLPKARAALWEWSAYATQADDAGNPAGTNRPTGTPCTPG